MAITLVTRVTTDKILTRGEVVCPAGLAVRLGAARRIVTDRLLRRDRAYRWKPEPEHGQPKSGAFHGRPELLGCSAGKPHARLCSMRLQIGFLRSLEEKTELRRAERPADLYDLHHFLGNDAE